MICCFAWARTKIIRSHRLEVCNPISGHQFYQVLPLNIRVKITFGQHCSVALLKGTSKVASYVCVVHWSRKNLEQAQ